MNALFLALSYLRYHWARSVVLVLFTAMIVSVPIISQVC
jgi:putative ABC transport system permease protein